MEAVIEAVESLLKAREDVGVAMNHRYMGSVPKYREEFALAEANLKAAEAELARKQEAVRIAEAKLAGLLGGWRGVAEVIGVPAIIDGHTLGAT